MNQMMGNIWRFLPGRGTKSDQVLGIQGGLSFMSDHV